MDKQEMQQRLESIEAEAKAIREALQKKEQWEPKCGNWRIVNSGAEKNIKSPQVVANFGITFATKAQAQKAAVAMRRHNRLLAYVAEHAPDWEPNWNDRILTKYFVTYNHLAAQWEVDRNAFCNAIQVYMPQNVAEELARKLNSGEVVL